MKKINYIIFAICMITAASCSKSFLDKNPQGELIVPQLTTQDGVEATLTGAYGLLNGNTNGTWGNYGAAPSQWLLGEVTSDNAHKGSENGDQPNMNLLERHAPTSTNDNLENLWNRCFEGILRCNNTLKILALVQGTDKKFPDARAKEITAEARLLRAHYNFFLVRAFKNVPLITEATTEPAVDNMKDIYPAIVEDLKFAVANLTPAFPKGQIGRVNQIAAKAYLGKVYLYQKKYLDALPLFNDVMASRPGIETIPYTDNFDVTKENGPEAVFAVQNSVGTDGSGGDNGNVGDMLNFPYNSSLPITCCGFFQPSIDLANSFKVTAAGLPYLDGSYTTNPYVSDRGVADKAGYKLDVTIPLDPRIDYTMGRRGVPFSDWGTMAGDAWIRDASNGGPFLALKNVVKASEISGFTAPGNTNITALNINIIRLADVYLMAAECEVEAGSLPNALALVNRIRDRASKLPKKQVGGVDVAAYRVSPYLTFPDQAYGRNAVRFERRMELSLEGHRFYDLVRWGILKQRMSDYFTFEGGYFNYLKGIVLADKDEYFPIPQTQIDRSKGILKQNLGY
ncbi:RagB/SusD family nutrient uptake outer membrane protein [Pedobacter gandavensis]|uniref:RagB/SusD family nutrient uptake outer membrane protein n=1 Tax=Pedobacter gandavensis TaxID=2679963 RepID=A0ABR6F2G9_9SPHI|nr:RagB/SusD family nutrient uptake outer membrane protein [Pedobacter gandavensis]MBB2151729.1 RagB/SusD family nutrient uptake outer membrane protein [Pedobacter gandavensis]